MQSKVRSYKFRLYPTDQQEPRLVETLDGCRWVYNYFYQKSNMHTYDMQFALTDLKEQHLWLYNYHSKMLQMVVHKIAAARKALEVLKRTGCYRVGRLHYLTRDEYNSFTYNQSGFRIEKGGKLWLSKIGSIKIVLHRQPVNIKQVVVCRQNERWYALVVCEAARPLFRFIDPNNTTIDCSRCGNTVPKSLAVRTHRCDVCGIVLDRDYNASLNILQKGLLSFHLLPVERREVTPAEIMHRSKKQEAHAFKCG